MYVESISRILLTFIVALTLTACGGGGGGGGGDSLIVGGGGTVGGGGSSGGGGSAATGTITLSVSGMVDASGSTDNVLAGNERATLTVEASENGVDGDLVVVFETTGGTLVESSKQTSGGTASVEIIGDGDAGAITVTATVTLSDGTQISDNITIQASADAPGLQIQLADGTDPDSIDLLSGESQQVKVVVTDWNGTALSGIGVSFTATAVDIDTETGVSNSDGEVTITLTGRSEQVSGTLSASATFNSFSLADSVAANSLGLDTSNNNVALDPIDVGVEGVLDGNEKVTVTARVTQDGAAKDGISVTFSATSGTLVPESATSSGGGIATVQLIGAGVAGTTQITATATFSGGAVVNDSQTIQTSAVKPTMDLVIRNQNGVSVTTFASNEQLTVEATVLDFDGSALDADDAGLPVTFDLGTVGTSNTTSSITGFESCPVVGIKAQTDCAFIEMISGDTAGVGAVSASATINGIAISDSVSVNNTGDSSSGSPDQDSFTITRNVDGENAAAGDTVALEGDQYNNQEATIRVDLADFFNNPVPDGTVVEFTTELGDIDPSCEISGGFCEVTYVTGEPRSPTNSEVSFNNLDDNDCPSNYIEDEPVTVAANGDGLTDYRVDDILRVRLAGSATILTKNTAYTVTSEGIDCITCVAGQNLEITYKRLWLDEENDSISNHVIFTPGAATQPFLDTQSTPCMAPSRSNLVRITGSIDPGASTVITGTGTAFTSELLPGDRLRLHREVREIVSITDDDTLTVDTAFTDAAVDTSPQRIAAPAYLGGMGQPYGGRSTILAYAVGEESFDDTNGNDEYDFGETFRDLPEVFIDKNEDGVLGDVNGESAVAGTVGPYRDGGTGTTAPGEAREKSNPYCYGPATITGISGDGNDSSEASRYCYQDGGEEELFVDANGNGVMDVGNGIYNGSRCLTPLQDADNDGNADDVVCTTDLVNISKEVQILLSGSFARTSFRAIDDDGEGGTFGWGEVISSIEAQGGVAITESIPTPSSWTSVIPAPGTVTLADNLQGLPFGGAVIDTTPLDGTNGGGGATTDDEEEVALFTISNPFTSGDADYTLSFDMTDITVGNIDVYVGSYATPVINDCGTATCTGTFDTSITGTGDLRFVVGTTGGTDWSAVLTISDVQLTGTTNGNTFDFESTENVVSNDRTDTTLTQFNVGETIDATTVFPGVSQREAPSGVVPTLSTTLRFGVFLFTDYYNGQLPEGTKVKLESDSSAGCALTAVGGVATTNDSREVVVGTDVTTWVTYNVAAGTGGGSLTATITTPIGNTTARSIFCSL